MITELYGGDEELLRRPIGLIDLKTKEERDYLRSGCHQLLPFRDHFDVEISKFSIEKLAYQKIFITNLIARFLVFYRYQIWRT